MIRVLKGTCVSARDPFILRGYLQAWNERGGAPFTASELEVLSNLEADPRKKPTPKPAPETFAVRMFEDPQ